MHIKNVVSPVPPHPALLNKTITVFFLKLQLVDAQRQVFRMTISSLQTSQIITIAIIMV